MNDIILTTADFRAALKINGDYAAIATQRHHDYAFTSTYFGLRGDEVCFGSTTFTSFDGTFRDFGMFDPQKNPMRDQTASWRERSIQALDSDSGVIWTDSVRVAYTMNDWLDLGDAQRCFNKAMETWRGRPNYDIAVVAWRSAQILEARRAENRRVAALDYFREVVVRSYDNSRRDERLMKTA